MTRYADELYLHGPGARPPTHPPTHAQTHPPTQRPTTHTHTHRITYTIDTPDEREATSLQQLGNHLGRTPAVALKPNRECGPRTVQSARLVQKFAPKWARRARIRTKIGAPRDILEPNQSVALVFVRLRARAVYSGDIPDDPLCGLQQSAQNLTPRRFPNAFKRSALDTNLADAHRHSHSHRHKHRHRHTNTWTWRKGERRREGEREFTRSSYEAPDAPPKPATPRAHERSTESGISTPRSVINRACCTTHKICTIKLNSGRCMSALVYNFKAE